jgi:polyhydroxyalkanoate synthesis regulator phasin
MGFKDFNEYSAEEIGLWLVAQGLGDHASKFVDEGVDGDLLLTLSTDDLKNDLGLSSLQAKKLLKNVEFSKMTGLSDNKGNEVDKLMEEVNELEEKVQVLEHAVKSKDREIAELRSKMSGMQVTAPPPPQPVPQSRAPAPAPKPAPAPAPARRGPGKSCSKHFPCVCVLHHGSIIAAKMFISTQCCPKGVVGGAARGAAGGAVKGAIGTIIYSIHTISTFSCSPFILSNILFPTGKNSSTVGAIVPGMDAADGAAAGAAVGALGGGVGGLRGRRHR